jgi:hypothetical protein
MEDDQKENIFSSSNNKSMLEKLLN